MKYTATYSPEDNKLRLYATQRLDEEAWAALKAAGFKWAPKQELFVAPMWTPEREDALLALAGEIGDEDTSLVDRQEARADRFDTLSDKRAADADAAHRAADAIGERFYGGQPILVGHHSEKRARKDQASMHSLMTKTVKMWETSQYWASRAEGAIRLAKYKERPDVRHRRIKGLEAGERKHLKIISRLEKQRVFWMQDGITLPMALKVANFFDRGGIVLDSGEYHWSLWSALTDEKVSLESAIAQKRETLPKAIAYERRWLSHYQNRLVFERAMLGDWAPEVKARPDHGPIVNYKAPGAIEITSAMWNAVPKDYRGTLKVVATHKHGAHRIRRACGVFLPKEHVPAGLGRHAYYSVFLSDAKVTPPPFGSDGPLLTPKRAPAVVRSAPRARREVPAKVLEMKASLKGGPAPVVAVPQLFPTPAAIAARMIDEAAIEPGMCVLEPSAGTGNLVRAIVERVDTEVLAYEINRDLCAHLERSFPEWKLQVRCRDFLEVMDFLGQYPRVVMNPPFANGSDIKHIRHALRFLAPGGRLVALCAAGARQKAFADAIGATWERLPDGSFKEQGTDVAVAMIVVG